MRRDTVHANLPSGERWSVFDALSWLTFGEVRKADHFFEFPKGDWSYDWKHWPPEWLGCAFQEIDSGQPWVSDLDDTWPGGRDGQRAWARHIIADTGKGAGELLKALTVDIERYHANREAWGKAKAGLNEAVRRGDLRVWGVKALSPSRPDSDGVHELLNPLLFTEMRGVNEGGSIDWPPDHMGFVNYHGPSYDQVFFDSDEVKAMWPAEGRKAWGVQAKNVAIQPKAVRPPTNLSKHNYSEDALAAWFVLRVRLWDKASPDPRESDDLEAATAFFARVPRDAFRRIRGKKTPESWRKKGPRSPRN